MATIQESRVSRLRAARELQGHSLRATARAADIDPGQLSLIERGRRRPSVDQLLRLARVLELRDVVKVLELFVEERP